MIYSGNDLLSSSFIFLLAPGKYPSIVTNLPLKKECGADLQWKEKLETLYVYDLKIRCSHLKQLSGPMAVALLIIMPTGMALTCRFLAGH